MAIKTYMLLLDEAQIKQEGGQSSAMVTDIPTINVRNTARCATGCYRPESAVTIAGIRKMRRDVR